MHVGILVVNHSMCMIKVRCRRKGWYEESNAALAVLAPSCLVQNAWGSVLAPSLSVHFSVNDW